MIWVIIIYVKILCVTVNKGLTPRRSHINYLIKRQFLPYRRINESKGGASEPINARLSLKYRPIVTKFNSPLTSLVRKNWAISTNH